MTERLILRNFVETDYDDLYEFLFQRKGYATEALFRQNVYFHKDENDNPIWQDTYVYAKLNQ